MLVAGARQYDDGGVLGTVSAVSGATAGSGVHIMVAGGSQARNAPVSPAPRTQSEDIIDGRGAVPHKDMKMRDQPAAPPSTVARVAAQSFDPHRQQEKPRAENAGYLSGSLPSIAQQSVIESRWRPGARTKVSGAYWSGANGQSYSFDRSRQFDFPSLLHRRQAVLTTTAPSWTCSRWSFRPPSHHRRRCQDQGNDAVRKYLDAGQEG